MTIKKLEEQGFRPVNTNINKPKEQMIGSLLLTKDGRLYASDIFATPQRTKGLCLKLDLSYGTPRMVPRFRVETKNKKA